MGEAARTAFVLAGGGSLGAIQVGMLRALVEHGVQPDLVIGTSVGAINAAYFSADPTASGVEQLAAVWREMRRDQVFPVSPWQGLLGLIGRKPSLVDPSALRALLERRLPIRRLEDARVPCHVIATDLLDGTERCLSSGPAAEALLASAAIPAIFPPVAWEGHFLVDGGVTNNTPIAAAARLGATRIVVLPTGAPCALAEAPRGALAVALQSLSLLIANQLGLDAVRHATQCAIAIVPPLCPLDVAVHDFSRASELIERGYEAAHRWIEAGGLTRGGAPFDFSPHVHAAPIAFAT